MAVLLNCPFCDHHYEFHRGQVSTCPSCALDITPPSHDESAPRIECSRKRVWLTTSLLPSGIIFLFVLPPYGAAVGFLMLFAFIGFADSTATRCGNCGAPLKHPRSKWCAICGATLEGQVA